MSNNPGKKGKPAPRDKRAAAHRDRALKEYRLAHHPAYAEWSKRRSEAFDPFMREAEITNPGLVGRLDASKVANKRLLKWEMANPTPMTWEEYTRLEVEFSAQYTPVDYS
jgi:hypothetical protein